MTYHGTVVRLRQSAGSKSDHQGVMLMTPEGPLKLRRTGGNPFADPELEKLVGREIDCDGVIHQGQLLMTKWNDAPSESE